ncbi:MAG: carbohydrate ABC transporter permease [Anaerolineae bacterium]|nr:carbohydrate ABC transporter permease [Anaerolineae bacterium]
MNTTTASTTQVEVTYEGRLRRRLYPIVMHLIMASAVFVVTFPLIYAIILSTQDSHLGSLVPGAAAAENFTTAWERVNMGQLMLNTLFVALGVALGKIVLSILGAYALIYFRVRGGMIILALVMLTHLLPLPVRIVPTYELLTDLGWVDTFKGLTIPFFASATGLLLFQQYFRTIPTDLADAARVDGAGPFRFLVSILVPVSRTNIGALFLIEFVYMWNQYLWPLIVANSDRTRQVQIGIKQLVATDSVIEWGILMAGTIMVIIPPLIVLLALQRTLMTGLTGATEDL